MSAVQKIETKADIVPLTPMDMLDRAIQAGANIETLSKLMDLQERWEKNEARKRFAEAIAQAKSEIKPVVRNASSHNAKKYADFAAIARAVDPVLSKHGLAYRFRTEQGDRITVTCILFGHGHSEESTLSGPPDKSGNKNDIQAIGSTLTYLQRYSLVQALGLAAADDDDGNAPGLGEPVNMEQAQELHDLIKKLGADAAAFCKVLKIENITDLPAKRFNEAKQRLQTWAAGRAKQ
jgi:hypothetical protein